MGETANLFAEMDLIADEPLRLEDLKFEFRQIQKIRQPNLSQTQWLDLFEVWLCGRLAKREARRADRHARIQDLLQERDTLADQRAFLPPAERAVANAWISTIALEIAGLIAPPPARPLSGGWG